MSTGAIIAIIIVIVVVVVAAVAAFTYSNRQRQLRRRFGPEYDRLVAELHSRRKAEAELAGRQRRVRDLNLRPLDQAAQARYADDWTTAQARFVDTPEGAVLDAQRLMMTLMNERGYPTEQEDQIIADLSVDHANVLDHYRVASHAAQDAAGGTASTEDLRQAMIHYRVLFRDLVGDSGQPDEAETGALTAGNGSAPAGSRFRPRTTAPDGQVPADADPAPAATTPAQTEPADDETAPADASADEPERADTTTGPGSAETVAGEPGDADTTAADTTAEAGPPKTAADETAADETALPEGEPDDARRRAG